MLPVSDFKIREKKRKNFNLFGKIRIKLLVVFSFAVAALFATQLVFASNLAIDGQKMSQADEQINQLEEENTRLKVQIAQESSLASLTKRAEDLGYKTPQDILILQK